MNWGGMADSSSLFLQMSFESAGTIVMVQSYKKIAMIQYIKVRLINKSILSIFLWGLQLLPVVRLSSFGFGMTFQIKISQWILNETWDHMISIASNYQDKHKRFRFYLSAIFLYGGIIWYSSM